MLLGGRLTQASRLGNASKIGPFFLKYAVPISQKTCRATAINAKRPEGKKLENNAQCRAIASQSIDAAANGNPNGDLNFALNLFGYSSKVWFKIDNPKDGKYAATFVTTFDYDGTKLNKFVQRITDGGNLGSGNIAQSTKWTQVGVVVKAVNGHTYMAISVAVDTNA